MYSKIFGPLPSYFRIGMNTPTVWILHTSPFALFS